MKQFRSPERPAIGDLGLSSLSKGGSTAVTAVEVSPSDEKYKRIAFELCVDALTKGCPDAFELVYWLAHRGPVVIDAMTEEAFTVPIDKLEWIQQQLVMVESAAHRFNHEKVYAASIQIADYFDAHKDYQAAERFHNRILQQCAATQDAKILCAAHLNAGAAQLRRANKEEAIKHFESALQYVRKNSSAQEEVDLYFRATAALTSTLLDSADAAAPDPSRQSSAQEAYRRAYALAEESGDVESATKAVQALGSFAAGTGNWSEALELRKQLLVVARRAALAATSEDGMQQATAAEAKARSALAALQLQLGSEEDAEASLKRALEVGQSLNDTSAVAEAALRLGLLAQRNDRTKDAVQYFTLENEAVSDSANQSVIGRSRVMLAIARATSAWEDGLFTFLCSSPHAATEFKKDPLSVWQRLQEQETSAGTSPSEHVAGQGIAAVRSAKPPSR